MIVLDDNIGSPSLARRIAAWYPGQVAILKDLRANTTIKSVLLRKFMRHPEFKTKARRMGVVALVRRTRIEFYRVDRKIETMNW